MVFEAGMSSWMDSATHSSSKMIEPINIVLEQMVSSRERMDGFSW